MNEVQLLRLKQQVDDAKTTISELNGHQQALMKQLREDWICNSIEEANKKIKAFNKDIDNLSLQLEQGIKELEAKFNV